MSKSVLVFVSHSSEDKQSYIEPIVRDLEDCYIRVWIDKKNIAPGDNLRQSILRDGLEKADIVLIFFTSQSLKSAWVDKEIKHVLREEMKKGNDFDLNKIISIFDSKETYDEINKRYPELIDDLMHLMPENYNKIQLAQLVSAIWNKYLSLQGGDVANQKQLLAKDKEIFAKDKAILDLQTKLNDALSKNSSAKQNEEFQSYLDSGLVKYFISNKERILSEQLVDRNASQDMSDAISFGLVEFMSRAHVRITQKGLDFFKWLALKSNIKS